ncbi:hypothetical protein D9M69_405590 [compost metagenome]
MYKPAKDQAGLDIRLLHYQGLVEKLDSVFVIGHLQPGTEWHDPVASTGQLQEFVETHQISKSHTDWHDLTKDTDLGHVDRRFIFLQTKNIFDVPKFADSGAITFQQVKHVVAVNCNVAFVPTTTDYPPFMFRFKGGDYSHVEET